LNDYVSEAMADVLEANDASAKANGRLVGRYVVLPTGDRSEPHLFRITGAGKATVTVEIVGKAPHGCRSRRFPVTRDSVMGRLHDRDHPPATWWETQPIGSTVHIARSGPHQMVRYTIVEHHEHQKTIAKLAPIALVGAGWEPLFTRQPQGYDGGLVSNAKAILAGEPVYMRAHDIVERRYQQGGCDPTAPAIARERLVALLSDHAAFWAAQEDARKEAYRRIKKVSVFGWKPLNLGLLGMTSRNCGAQDPKATLWEVQVTSNGTATRRQYRTLAAARRSAKQSANALGIEVTEETQ